jgi:starch phosphorylase
LSGLITWKIGEPWMKDIYETKPLEEFADDMEFHQDWRLVKLKNKEVLAAVIQQLTGLVVDPASLFDIRVTRLQEYKR